MEKNTLIENIKRIHQIIGIEPNILIESEINENNPIASEGAKVFAKIFTNLEKPLVVGSKNYTKTQVKTIIQKAGTSTLTADEKAVMQALSKDLISLDKKLITRLSSEVFGEMEKLNNRQLKTKFYSEVKAGLKELLPDSEVNKVIRNVDTKIAAKKPSGGQQTKPGTHQPNVMSGGLNNLPAAASVDDIMEEILIDPIFKSIIENKKGSQELVREWVTKNVGKGATADDIIKAAGPYIERVQQAPGAPIKKVNVGGVLDSIFSIAQRGDKAWASAKGGAKWALAIGLVLVITGVISIKEYGSLIGCRLGWDWSNKMFGCDGTSSDQQNTNNNSNDGVDWSKYKPAN